MDFLFCNTIFRLLAVAPLAISVNICVLSKINKYININDLTDFQILKLRVLLFKEHLNPNDMGLLMPSKLVRILYLGNE